MRRPLLLETIAVVCALCGCTEKLGYERSYEQGQAPETEWEQAGLTFVNELTRRNFSDAHRMLGGDLQKSLTTQDLAVAMERLTSEQFVKMDEPWVLGSIDRWPDKQSTDLGMAYVQIGGDGNEAIIVTVARERDGMRVRKIEWGRP